MMIEKRTPPAIKGRADGAEGCSDELSLKSTCSASVLQEIFINVYLAAALADAYDVPIVAELIDILDALDTDDDREIDLDMTEVGSDER